MNYQSNTIRDRVRRATPGDVPEIARIHRQAFVDSFLARMGASFLCAYYRSVLEHDGGIMLVHEAPAGIDGFVSGFVRPESFYTLLKRSKWALAKPLAAAFIRHPSLLGRIFYNVRRVAIRSPRTIPEGCELSSIAVDPSAQKSGVGKLLVNAFIDQAWRDGAASVYLTTDASENAAVNRFYQRLGFELRERFEQYRGRILNEYILFRNTRIQAPGKTA